MVQPDTTMATNAHTRLVEEDNLSPDKVLPSAVIYNILLWFADVIKQAVNSCTTLRALMI